MALVYILPSHFPTIKWKTDKRSTELGKTGRHKSSIKALRGEINPLEPATSDMTNGRVRNPADIRPRN